MTPESLAARQHALITTAQAVRLGLKAHEIRARVRSGRWWTVHPAVHGIAGAPRTWHQSALAAVLYAGEGAVASHSTAARLLGLRVPDLDPVPDPAVAKHELTTGPSRRVRRDGIRQHRSQLLFDHDRGVRDHVPVTSPARTLVDLSGRLEGRELGRLVDQLLRRRALTLLGLHRAASRLGPAPGRSIATVESVLRARWPGYDPGDSDLETRVLVAVRAAGLALPRQQVWVRVEGRRYRVDLLWPAERVIVEIDSWRYHGNRTSFDTDPARKNALQRAGFTVITVTDGMTDAEIVREITLALAAAATA